MLVSSSGGDGGRDAKDRVKRFFGNAAFLQGTDCSIGTLIAFEFDFIFVVSSLL